jgi:bacterioferritin-associated ferredoxin
MGGIISDLKHKSETFIQVDRYFPSTKTCHKCGNIQEVLLSERIFTCQVCKAVEDRDIHSAINILNEGMKSFRLMGSPEDVKSPVEGLISSSIAFEDTGKSVSMNQEAVAHDPATRRQTMSACERSKSLMLVNPWKQESKSAIVTGTFPG